MMAQVHAQILANLKELEQIMPHFLATLSQNKHTYLLSHTSDNLPNTQTAQIPTHCHMHHGAAIDSGGILPLMHAAPAPKPATTHVLRHLVLQFQQQLPSTCMPAYQTHGLTHPPLKHHVHFKTPALCSRGHPLFWPKEDMCPP